MKKIIHIITGLGSGGAENMLHKLLKYSDKNKYQHEVISLMDGGVFGERIQQMGIKVHCLNLNQRNIFSSLMKSRKLSKDADIVNTWLYHADIFGFIVAKILLRKKLIWNIRHSNLDKNANKSRTLKIVKLNSILSKYVDLITYNSNKALETHVEFGYKNKKSVVIPNGFELDKFQFDQSERSKIRNNLNLEDNERAIITVGRWDIQKDYYTLLKALENLKKRNHNFKMLMVGTNLDDKNDELISLVSKHGLENQIILLGRQDNISGLLSAADIYVSSSLGESFSNSIGEAMACELPMVVTDVGDSKLVVGSTGKIVQAQDYRAISQALEEFLKCEFLPRNLTAREKILESYDILQIIPQFETKWKDNEMID